jgi:osmotically-inducible protein OsmY
MGRVVSHPSSISVEASDGHVTLSGPILGREADDLV